MVKKARPSLMTKANILHSGCEEFIAKGFHAASLESIAERAKVTRGAIYWHFKNKTALSKEILSMVVRRLVDIAPLNDDDEQAYTCFMMKKCTAAMIEDRDFRLYIHALIATVRESDRLKSYLHNTLLAAFQSSCHPVAIYAENDVRSNAFYALLHSAIVAHLTMINEFLLNHARYDYPPATLSDARHFLDDTFSAQMDRLYGARAVFHEKVRSK